MEVFFFEGRVQALNMNRIDSYLEGALAQEKKAGICTPNAEIAMEAKDEAWIRDLLNSGDLKLADGIGLVVGAKINRIPLEGRVTDFDVSVHLLQIAQREGYRVYFLEAKKGIAQGTAQGVEEDYPGLVVVGSHHGYYEESSLDRGLTQDEEEIIEEIRRLQADIIFVDLGFPVQEIFIRRASQGLDRGVWIDNGGVLDILVREQKRAPEIFTRLHLEWFYRLIENPGRWKRQLAMPKFLIQVVAEKSAVKVVREDFNENESKGN